MNKLLLFLLLLPFGVSAQLIQKNTTYGMAFNRTGADTLFYLPGDTFAVPTAYRTYNFMARKGTTLYIWNTSTFAWQAVTGGGGGAGWELTGNALTAGQFIGSTNSEPVVVKANNTEHMRVLSGGNVGIGTSTPTHKFQVFGGASKFDSTIISNGTSDEDYMIRHRTVGLGFPVTTIKPVTNNKNIAFDIMPRGAPGNYSDNGIAWLDVCDTDVSDGAGAVGAARVGISTTAVEFGSRAFSGGTVKPVNINVNTDTRIILSTSNTATFNIGKITQSQSVDADYVGYSLLNTNNTGVGSDAIMFIGNDFGTSRFGFLRWNNNAAVASAALRPNSLQIATNDGATGGIAFGAFGTNGKFTWSTGSGVGITEKMRLDSAGNLGIGLSSPAFKLDVGGTSSVSDRKIGINGFPVIYLPDQTAYSGSIFYGTNAINLSNSGGGFNGAANTALGINAMDSITTGFFNTAFGNWALHNTTSGDENTAIGLNALKFNTTGEFNTAVGTTALFRNTTGQTNTAIGNQALRENTTGLQNTAVGYRPLQTNTTGYFNTAVAYRALEDNTTGYGNTGIGLHALSNNTTGYYNSAIGMYSMDAITTGRGNTGLGYYAGNSVSQKADAINSVALGSYSYTTADNQLRLSDSLTRITILGISRGGVDYALCDSLGDGQFWVARPVATPTNTLTLENKRWKARVGSTTSSATPTINTDNVDIYKLTAQAADITSFTTNLSGTPNDGDILEIQITGTAARAITWGSAFVSSTVTLPATTVTTATLTVVVQYFTTSSYGNNKWVCVNYF